MVRMLYVLLLLVLVVAGMLASLALGVDEQDVLTMVSELDYGQLAESVRHSLSESTEPLASDDLELPLWLLASVNLENLIREYSPAVALSVYEYLFAGTPLKLELETAPLRAELVALFRDHEKLLYILEQVNPDSAIWLRKMPAVIRNWALSELAELAESQVQGLPETMELWALVETEEPQVLIDLAKARRLVKLYPPGLGLLYGLCVCWGLAILLRRPMFFEQGILMVAAGLALLTLGYNGEIIVKHLAPGDYRWLGGILGAWFHRGSRLPGLSYLGLGFIILILGWVKGRAANIDMGECGCE